MGFGDLKTEAGITVLNEYLQDKSYIDAYTPSQADVAVFHLMAGAPDGKFAHALRWYTHIKTYTAHFEALPGIMGMSEKFGPIKRQQVAEVDEDDEMFGFAPPSDSDEDDDDDEDLFGSDSDEDEAEAERIKQERLKAYADKKAKKPGPIAKSNIILDVKPWDDETDMTEVESLVRTIKCDGLLWGASKLVDVGYGIKKLQIACVVEDDKVSTDFLEEEITAFEEHVQSMDIAAFNKV
jgi:elongation factor 1-beta